MNVRTKGLVCGAVAAATYGMNPLFTLPLYHAGMTPDSVLFYRYAFALPILAVMIRLRGQDFSLRRCEMLPLVAMGLLFSASSLFLYMSYNYMDAGIASTILFVYPILVALIMALGFRERITPLTIFCIALAVLGIGLLYEGDGQTLSLTGVTLVLLSSLSYAVYIVGVNRSALGGLADGQAHLLRPAVRPCDLRRAARFPHGLQAVPSWYLWGNVLALAALPTAVSLLWHHAGHPLHRLHADGHPRCARTRHGGLLRRGDFPRRTYGAAGTRHRADTGGRDAHRRRRAVRLFLAPLPAALSQTAQKNGSLSSGFRSGGACSVYSNHPRMAAITSSRIGSGRVAMRVRCDPPGCTKSFMLRLRASRPMPRPMPSTDRWRRRSSLCSGLRV